PPGRFCVGLPTEQSTGLPARVDARFFAKINRDGVNFDQREGYNELLLDVATDLFGRLLKRLHDSERLSERRAATLALHRPAEPNWWEPFVSKLIRCFPISDLEHLSWLPIGAFDLTSPTRRVFLPAPVEIQGDDEEVVDVPARVASRLHLLDASAMRLRE